MPYNAPYPWDSIQDSLLVSLRRALYASFHAALGESLRASLWVAIWVSLEDSFMEPLYDPLIESFYDPLRKSPGGSEDHPEWHDMRDPWAPTDGSPLDSLMSSLKNALEESNRAE